jgi:hypothetical protein
MEQTLFLELQDLVEHLSIEQPEVGRAGLDLDAAQEHEHLVVRARSDALEPRQVRRVAPDGVHDLEALAPLRHELWQQLRRMLQIGVHHDDGLTARGREARHQCALVSEIARQANAAHARVALVQ